MGRALPAPRNWRRGAGAPTTAPAAARLQVSRSLAACEGCLLVVDASQGVEAQTLANVYLALENDLEIIPVLNKIDLPGGWRRRGRRRRQGWHAGQGARRSRSAAWWAAQERWGARSRRSVQGSCACGGGLWRLHRAPAGPARPPTPPALARPAGADPERVKREIEEVIGLDCSHAIMASAKQGLGIEEILEEVVRRVPPPADNRGKPLRALIFDSYYDSYKVLARGTACRTVPLCCL